MTELFQAVLVYFMGTGFVEVPSGSLEARGTRTFVKAGAPEFPHVGSDVRTICEWDDGTVFLTIDTVQAGQFISKGHLVQGEWEFSDMEDFETHKRYDEEAAAEARWEQENTPHGCMTPQEYNAGRLAEQYIWNQNNLT